ncbi:MAG: methionyl-tRNA formyltransferase [Methylobacteriaceae bacterium]|jgi:methionyl-tRNA formyltransferase|nr:methionyl-tRNA formyltransferase [Methylobacteriaceae bacterium]
MSLKTVFMGTPDFAVAVLQALADSNHELVAVFTRPPAPAGRRGRAPTLSPVHKKANELDIPVFTPRTLKDPDVIALFPGLGADIAVVAAYGLLLPKPVLTAPRLGCVNVHASLLPRWRGAAPIQRAVMAGDARSGVSIMRMEEGLDTGPVALDEAVDIPLEMTAGELQGRLQEIGGRMAVTALNLLERDELVFVPQPQEGITYAAKLSNENGRIRWDEDCLAVHNHVRGLSPFPGAFTEADFGKGPERVKLLRTTPEPDVAGEPGSIRKDGVVACLTGGVRVDSLQRAGRAPMAMDAFLRGVHTTTRLRFL